MKPTFTFVLIISLFLISCPKDKTEQPENKITITGIFARDPAGYPTGEVDLTDWTSDAAFPAEVNTLLNFTDTLDYSSADTSTVTVEAFPNPIDQLFTLVTGSSNPTIMKFIIVDESLKVYTQQTINFNSGNHSMLILTDSLFPANKYYRMYYAFYDKTKTIYYKGHGDLKKN